MGRGYSAVSRRCQRHGHARRLGQGDECDRAETARADRWFRRPRSVHAYRTQGLWRFQPDRNPWRRSAGFRPCRLEPCRSQSALRRARTRDGCDRQRSGCARRHNSIRFDLPDLLRLHASVDPAGRIDGIARRACVHPRQHCAGRGWSDPSAGGTTGIVAGNSESDRDPPRRCQRNRGGVAHRCGNA